MELKNWQVVQWKFYQAVNGVYGFLEVDGLEENIFVFWDNKNGALDQDIVEAKIKKFKWKFEAVITKIIKRADRILIWEFEKAKKWNYGFVKVFNQAIKNDIFIPEKDLNNAKNKQIVAVRILRWEGKNPEWKIVEILWNATNPETMINGYILEAGFKLDFPKWVKQEMKKIKAPDIEKILSSTKRKDKRKLFTFTIDGEDAKDLDDAISIDKLDNGWMLYVHIADVAHYVKSGSITQQEALSRWTSVYLPHRVLPMLPTKLSNDLCSLNPHTDKLTLTCQMHIDNNGQVWQIKVYESVINSDFRLTYKEVQDMKDGKLKENDKLMFGWLITKQLLEKINLAYELKDKLRSLKIENWLLWFDFPETKIILDENLQVVDFKPYPIYDSNNLIEEFMVLANESVSKKFHKLPFLYRIHEKPKMEDIEKLKKILLVFWVHYDFVHYDTKEFADLIEKVKEHKEKYVLEKLILRTLTKAEYSDKNLWHFGLWLWYYSHFTSPIRRYPDYQIHRIIKLKLANKMYGKTLYAYKKKLENIAKKCSEQEIKAQKLEWKVRDYFMVQYFKNKIWQEYEWIVSWMIPAWVFVELDNTAEWFVELVEKEDKNPEWIADMEILEFVNQKTWQKITMWQKVNVKVIWVDEKRLRINFELLLSPGTDL